MAARAGVNGGVPEARAQLLHVTNGESAGNTLRQTSLGGAVLPWQDVLHEGPVQMLPRPELLRSRAAFLSECGWGSELPILSAFERRDRLLMDALEGGCQVVLWFEHDLYDQLQLLDVLSLAHDAGVAPELVAAGPSVQRPGFRGLGELAAVELEELWPTRSAVTTDVLAAAAAAWDAFRAPEPARLAQLAQQESGAAVPRGGPATTARGAARARRRPLDHRASCARGDLRGRTHSARRLPRRPGARAGAVSRGHLVLPGTRRARSRPFAPRGNSSRRGAPRGPAARRRASIRPSRHRAHAKWRACPSGRGRSGRPARHRPVGGGHAHHGRARVEVGPGRRCAPLAPAAALAGPRRRDGVRSPLELIA